MEKVVRAIVRMLRLGCPWRDLECEGIHWRTVYGYFVAWRESGAIDALLKRMARRSRSKLRFLDASYVRVHHSGSNPRGGQEQELMGRGRGGLSTKIHAICDSQGRILHLLLSAGNRTDINSARAMVEHLREGVLVADKGYDADWLRELLFENDVFPCIPTLSTRKEARPFHRGFYRKRHRIENCFEVLKRYRRVSSRYEKLATSFLTFASLAALQTWIS